MQHEEHSTPAAPGFGTNTNGLGIFIVAVVAVCLALFCWNFWKDAKKAHDHYRWTSLPAAHGDAHGEGHGEGHEAGHATHAPAEAAHGADTTSATDHHHDSTGAHSDDSTGHH